MELASTSQTTDLRKNQRQEPESSRSRSESSEELSFAAYLGEASRPTGTPEAARPLWQAQQSLVRALGGSPGKAWEMLQALARPGKSLPGGSSGAGAHRAGALLESLPGSETREPDRSSARELAARGREDDRWRRNPSDREVFRPEPAAERAARQEKQERQAARAEDSRAASQADPVSEEPAETEETSAEAEGRERAPDEAAERSDERRSELPAAAAAEPTTQTSPGLGAEAGARAAAPASGSSPVGSVDGVASSAVAAARGAAAPAPGAPTATTPAPAGNSGPAPAGGPEPATGPPPQNLSLPGPAAPSTEPPAPAAGTAESGASSRPAAPQVPGQILRALKQALQHGQQSFQIHLDPPELGRVQLHFSVDGDRMKVRLEVGSEVTRQVLQDALPQLRELLQGEAFQLEGFEVLCQNPDSNSEAGNGSGAPEDSPRPAPFGPGSVDPEESPAESDRWARTAGFFSERGVNLVA